MEYVQFIQTLPETRSVAYQTVVKGWSRKGPHIVVKLCSFIRREKKIIYYEQGNLRSEFISQANGVNIEAETNCSDDYQRSPQRHYLPRETEHIHKPKFKKIFISK